MRSASHAHSDSPLTITTTTGYHCAHNRRHTYDDHRMAMAFSLVACGGVPVVINDPGCTRKTFPTYFKVLDSVTQR